MVLAVVREVERRFGLLSVVRSRTLIPNETGFDPAHSTGVVGSVVALTILAVAAFFYTRRRRQK